MTNFENVPTPDLRVGDIIHNSGMRIQLETDNTVEFGLTGTTRHFHGRILNAAEVDAAGIVNRGWRNYYDRNGIESTEVYPVGTYWAVQGNEYARWTREI